MKYSVIGLFALLTSIAACATTPIVSLVGEEPEVSRLLKTQQAPLPQTSPEATARRLYLALSQGDHEVSWALLSEKTRHLLNQRASLAGTTGPELLQSSSLPQPNGQVIKVNYVAVFFGSGLQTLRPLKGTQNAPDLRKLEAISEKGDVRTLDFVREPDGWKLHPTGL